MDRRAAFTFGAASLIPALWVQYATAGNTTCASGQLDWYTSVVGESPCITYQRLRQICNGDYQVPNFRPNTPGDQCDDQVSACCCNTVAFQLSMLCMNCQYDTQDGDQIGIDAGVGAYQLYQYGCGAGTNRSLPTDIQSGVCNQGIRLDDFLYGGWDDGSWYYVWTKENAERTHAANNNKTFTHCPNDSSPSSTSTSTSTTTTSSNPPSSSSTSTSSVDSPTSTSSTSASTSSTSSSSNTSSSTRNSTSSSMSSTSTDPAGAALITNSGSPDLSSLVTPTATSGNSSSGSRSHTNTGAILGGAIGGVVGGVIIIGGAIIFCCMGRNKKTWLSPTPIPHMTYHDGPAPLGSAAPMATQASLRTSEGPDSLHDVPPMALATTTGATFPSPPASHSGHSHGPSSAALSDDPLRHEDGGPVFGLYRSPSGRLPPAYRSWERGTDSGGSNSGMGSAAGEGPMSGYSEGQSFGAPPSRTELPYYDPPPSSAGMRRPLPSPSPAGFDLSKPPPPLAPLRRLSTMKGLRSA